MLQGGMFTIHPLFSCSFSVRFEHSLCPTLLTNIWRKNEEVELFQRQNLPQVLRWVTGWETSVHFLCSNCCSRFYVCLYDAFMSHCIRSKKTTILVPLNELTPFTLTSDEFNSVVDDVTSVREVSLFDRIDNEIAQCYRWRVTKTSSVRSTEECDGRHFFVILCHLSCVVLFCCDGLS